MGVAPDAFTLIALFTSDPWYSLRWTNLYTESGPMQTSVATTQIY